MDAGLTKKHKLHHNSVKSNPWKINDRQNEMSKSADFSLQKDGEWQGAVTWRGTKDRTDPSRWRRLRKSSWSPTRCSGRRPVRRVNVWVSR